MDDRLHPYPPSVSALHIRAAMPYDREPILRMAQAADMGELSATGSFYVAESDGAAIGFIRLVKDDGRWFVNPIVVDAAYRQHGAGSALMRFARKMFGPLRFVARGSVVPFYEKIGCAVLRWDEISPVVAQDCDGCETRATCYPQPMILA